MSDSSDMDAARIAWHEAGPLAWAAVTRPGLCESYATCVPHDAIGTADAATQAGEVYDALGSWLREQGASGVQERIFGNSDFREAILAQRQALLATEADCRLWPATFVEGAPCDHEGLAGTYLYAVAGPECSPIYDDNQLSGVAFEHRDTQHVYLSGVSGRGTAESRQQEACDMFARADAILCATGCSYADVVRTWIYLADILEWYDEFNPIRSDFYSQLRSIAQTSSSWPPASTGIGARLPGPAHCLLDLFALAGPGRRYVSVQPLHNPRQKEAYSYGSAFSRGMAITFGGIETVYVSGTAAVGEEGQSLCVGDLEGQVIRTLDNIASLLGTRRMTLADFVSSTVFIKQGHDVKLVRELIGDRGELLANSIYVAADICRPELLLEIDGIAVRTPD